MGDVNAKLFFENVFHLKLNQIFKDFTASLLINKSLLNLNEYFK